MLVRAIAQGYYGDVLREIGSVFEMEEAIYRPRGEDGKPLLRKGVPAVCKWVVPVEAGEKIPAYVAPLGRPAGAGPTPGSLVDKGAPKEPSKAEAKTKSDKQNEL